MTEFRYDWQDPEDPPDAYDRLTRPVERWPEPERDPRHERRGKPMTQAELDDFTTRGGKINYGEARLAKQQLNDQRYEQRRRRNQNLMNIVVDVVAVWDSSEYLERHRRTAREILAKPCNHRRRQLSGMSKMQKRHQQAIRLVHALAFDEINQAEYCRRHNLDPASASRMLAHLYEKEPRLRDAVDAINACAATASWQNRQQQQMFRYRERGIRLTYGYDYTDVADNGWLCDYTAGGIRRTSGRLETIGLIADEPFRPFDLHKPDTWHKLGFLCVEWNTLYEPMRATRRLEPTPNRYRAISRRVRLKKNPDTCKPRCETWHIARAMPIVERGARPLTHQDRTEWPATDHRFFDRLYRAGWGQTREDRKELKRKMLGLLLPQDPRFAPRRAQPKLAVVECRIISRRPLCRPAHSGMWLTAVAVKLRPSVPFWEPLSSGHKPCSEFIAPFTRVDWTFLARKDVDAKYEAKAIGPGVYRFYLPCRSRRDLSQPQQP